MNTKLTTKIVLVVVLALLIAGGITTMLVLKSQARQAEQAAKLARTANPPPARQVETPAPAATSAPVAVNQPRRQKPPLQDPQAREALPLVGADWVATEYWVAAINDPKIPDNERSDLIEDLNENGFTNNKRPALEDLPLIETRITLIEMLAPSAMDQVNADAFQEAYKDLTNMRARLLGLPDPPRRNLIPR